jgi:hypothetical protein
LKESKKVDRLVASLAVELVALWAKLLVGMTAVMMGTWKAGQ